MHPRFYMEVSGQPHAPAALPVQDINICLHVYVLCCGEGESSARTDHSS
jgi:hypothetical protein